MHAALPARANATRATIPAASGVRARTAKAAASGVRETIGTTIATTVPPLQLQAIDATESLMGGRLAAKHRLPQLLPGGTSQGTALPVCTRLSLPARQTTQTEAGPPSLLQLHLLLGS